MPNSNVLFEKKLPHFSIEDMVDIQDKSVECSANSSHESSSKQYPDALEKQ